MPDWVTSAEFWTIIGGMAAVATLLVALYTPLVSAKARIVRRLRLTSSNAPGIDDAVSTYIRRRVRRYFRGYSAWILVRYGSSVRIDATAARDFDYLVLLLGYPKSSTKTDLSAADEFVVADTTNAVDIEYRDITSFVFGLVAGMPYEHSVVANYVQVGGPQGYMRWLERLASNIRVDRSYVIEQLTERQRDLVKDIERDLGGICNYGTIVKMYLFASALIQVDLLETLPECVPHKALASMADGPTLLRLLPNDEMRDAYAELLRYFKRETSLPSDLKPLVRGWKTAFAPAAQKVVNDGRPDLKVQFKFS